MTEPMVEVKITAENWISLLETLEQVALAEMEAFLADAPDACIARAAESLRIQEQVLSSATDPNGTILQALLRACPPCPCGRKGGVMAGAVYRVLEGGQGRADANADESEGDQR
jgi:hypothetical protein